MTGLSLGNIICSAKKKNLYILGLVTTSHLKVFAMNLKTGLAPETAFQWMSHASGKWLGM
jgi:hypothetical protein